MEQYPHTTFENYRFYGASLKLHDAYTLDIECTFDEDIYHYHVESTGNVYPTQACFDKHQSLCGENYTPEILPSEPGCFSEGISELKSIQVLSFDSQLLDVPWIAKDVLSPEESEALWYLSYIHEDDEEEGRQILAMPFLKTIDALDVSALRSLTWLGGATLRHVLAHPSLRDGITDEWTDVVAVLSLVFPAYEEVEATEQETADKWELIDTILTPDRTTVIRRLLALPLAGEVPATVVWPDAMDHEAPVRFMDVMEHAIRTQEEFMGVPFPQPFALMIVADLHEKGGRLAVDGIVVVSDEERGWIIPHEVAHIYFGIYYGSKWILEGGAEFLAVFTRDKTAVGRVGGPPGCETFANIAEWDRTEAEQGTSWYYQQGCHYHLGEHLFHALYKGLGDSAFREGFARLYLNNANELDWACSGIHAGLCRVKAAFVDSASPKEAAIADEIIDRYYGSVP